MRDGVGQSKDGGAEREGEGEKRRGEERSGRCGEEGRGEEHRLGGWQGGNRRRIARSGGRGPTRFLVGASPGGGERAAVHLHSGVSTIVGSGRVVSRISNEHNNMPDTGLGTICAELGVVDPQGGELGAPEDRKRTRFR